ncbi:MULTISPECIES: ubiquinone anaerobic biosynthesis protein UbiU [Pseudovibrio]|uniref:ubiquinone anaerobic biosynthesis protein UbiU n=1 Tax=Stappiaceae TaxID=2821832 RepID=UPI002365E810|nr:MULTISPECIES: peptidase U32 family protein [Pseudovibrio]MDD7909877.1 U32 family peptidase [Pseudovibrio exalbescens]MDX5592215.1 peptidase U32 family protein [Pseudovibrio sp. SPO723]
MSLETTQDSHLLELVCPAGTPAALKAAAEAGAHSIYCGFRNETNARNFPGLNFSEKELNAGVKTAARHGANVLVAVNTFARAGDTELWTRAVDAVAASGAHAMIVADLAVLDYAATHHPNLRLHLSVQAAAATPESVNFYAETFGVQRVVLPRVMSVEEIVRLNKEIDTETEVFVFGGLCVMTEGRCSLSSYATGKSPNLTGVCSPPGDVDYQENGGTLSARLGGFTIDCFTQGETAGYPTLCKGRFQAEGETSYLFEDPVSLNAASLLPKLHKAGVTAIKIEGRQRGKAYISQVVKAFRTAVDGLREGKTSEEEVSAMLASMTEGGRETTGAYKKIWR